MGLEEIQKEVLGVAEKEAAKRRKAAQSEADSIIKEAKDKAAKMKKEAAEELKRKLEHETHRTVEAARFEAKTSLFRLQKDLMNDALESAREKLAGLPEKKRKTHIAALIGKAKKDIEVSRVLCNKRDVKLVEGLDAEEAGIMGGIIAENQDGSLRVDLSYDSLFQEIVDEDMSAMYQQLFGGQKR